MRLAGGVAAMPPLPCCRGVARWCSGSLGYSLSVDWSHRPAAPDTIAYRVEARCNTPGPEEARNGLGELSASSASSARALHLGPDWTTISPLGDKCMKRRFTTDGLLVAGGLYSVRVFAFNAIGESRPSLATEITIAPLMSKQQQIDSLRAARREEAQSVAAADAAATRRAQEKAR
mmetsp:Transcript_76442/g.218940  ORF Transcript_76442/g.218940 Transcript_76442/m.218940 type:complete len:176 (+) Transcript_76442:662-1189(+)